ncbi:MAG: dihydropteroate synthase [Candidatus Adiutrix sp.]|jgi:dihydropteroate synthase|nr:dihydropteroate synthase [Candidatus Adiutrix sp.]
MTNTPETRATAGLPDLLTWRTTAGEWTLDFTRPLIMSIINLTPDSFSDGGRFGGPDEAVEAALAEETDGADIFDLGAESTRPGSARVSEADEWARLEPVLRGLAARSRRPISIDTYKTAVAEKAIAAGAAIINDIYAGRREPRLLETAAAAGVPVILMHMKGDPDNMQKNPHYDDVVQEVRDFLLERAQAAEAAGIPRERIILDPGLGFGKNIDHNLSLMKHFDEAVPAGYRRLMALSRKNFLGLLMDGAPPAERDGLTAVAGVMSLMRGADILRVHKARPSRDAVRLARAVAEAA